jgi:hypothetical protein
MINRLSLAVLVFVIGFLVLVPAAPHANKSAEQYWQVVLEYSPSGVTVVAADPMPSLRKQVRTPGLASAAGVIQYQLEWKNTQGTTIATSTADLPLGHRCVIGPGATPAEIMRIAEQPIPPSGVTIMRIKGPDPTADTPRSLHLQRLGLHRAAADTTNLPLAFQTQNLKLPLPPPKSRESQKSQGRDGLVSSTKIQDTGADDNRAVFVVLGDGYTAANLAANKFTNETASFLSEFNAAPPWSELATAMNIYRGDVESNEEGADDKDNASDPLTLVDTYFNSSYWVAGIERLLSIDGTGRARAFQAADQIAGVGVWDQIVLLVNSNKYGGAGGTIAVSSVNAAAGEISIHEVGHSFAGLADEYSTPFPGFPPGDPEPNVDFDASGPGLKWLIWVDESTPLPTPNTSQFNDVVGTFEGARYLTTGIYRPKRNCKMRSLGVPFCEVCTEQHIVSYHALVDLADATSQPAGSTIQVGESGASISVTPLPIGGLTYEWTLDGTPIPDATSSSVTVQPSNFSGAATLALTVRYDTTSVRKTTITDTYTWQLAAPLATTYWLTK